jgi:hypothetical protein
MTRDLASRVRRLVDGGAPSIALDEIAHRGSTDHSSNKRHAVFAAVLVLIVVSVGAVVAARVRGGPGDLSVAGRLSTSPVTQIPQGMSVQQFGQRLAFVMRDGNHFNVFDTDVHHLRGENGLWWCPNEHLFASPTHAETFSRAGKAIGGPARAGLDRFRATVHHDKLSIDPSHLITGAKGNAQTVAGQTAGNGAGQWDSGPTSFCAGALKADNGAPTATLDVNATFGGYDKKIYDVPRGLTEIRLSGIRGIILEFDDPRYSYCLLGTDPGARHTCRVSLSPGDYVVGSIPGHRRAGYEAIIHVTTPPNPP